MKNRNSLYGMIIAAAIVGLAGLAFAGGGMMGGGGGYGGGMMGGGGGYGHGMMGNGNGYGQGRMGNGYGSGYGMMNQGRGYGDRNGNYGYDNRSREDSERMQQSGSRFDEATRGLRNDIQDKQEALQNEMDKTTPDRDKVHRLQSELSQLRAEYDRQALDFQLENRKAQSND